MPSFNYRKDSFVKGAIDGKTFELTKRSFFESFNPKVLGLGDIGSTADSKSAIAAIFDLEGFTNFCGKIEPSLSVPLFLSEFLEWLFTAIRTESVFKEIPIGVLPWHHLPFFAKFMGDGLLVLWDTAELQAKHQHNLIASCAAIIKRYETEFHPKIRRKVSHAPQKLRCGIAKGTVLSVGNGEDYVGSCINLAARLQKMPGVDISFARMGFNPEVQWKGMRNIKHWVLVKVAIRGIGDGELIYIRKKCYDALGAEDKKSYLEP